MPTRLFGLVALALLMTASLAVAGNPHFVSCTVTGSTPTSITVAAKEAGLGDEAQIEVLLTALAECVNPGGNKPSAANKEDVATAATVPVQNGKANYTLTGTADFQPECSPPMSLVFSNILITDLTHGITCEP